MDVALGGNGAASGRREAQGGIADTTVLEPAVDEFGASNLAVCKSDPSEVAVIDDL